MRIVTANEWQQWLAQGKVLEKDRRGPKVLRLADGRLVKVFRPRRRLWLARLVPAAKRFSINAIRLKALQVVVPQVEEYFWLDREQAVSACLYVPLPGVSLAEVYKRSRGEFDLLLPEFAKFVHLLHQRGIYFRSLHMGNVLHLPEGGFGLIDFLDIRFKGAPLGLRLIDRNMHHFQGYLGRAKIADFPWQQFRGLLSVAEAEK